MEILENKTTKRIIKKRKRDVKIEDEDRCNAKIWHMKDMEYTDFTNNQTRFEHQNCKKQEFTNTN